MKETYDLIVAGAGPAGLTAAKTASSEGLDVLILELQAQIGQTQTSAWITSEILDEKLKDSIKTEVNKIGLHSIHKNLEIEGNFGKIIDRKIYDKLLASKAVKTGVEIWVSSPVKTLLKGKKGIKGVRSEAGEWTEEIESKVVIDATGGKAEWASLFLREVLGSDWDREKTSQTNEYLMTNASGVNVVDLYFSSVFAPRGYAWVHPFSNDFVMSGIQGVRIHPDSALDEFIGREQPERLENSVPIGAYRGKLPVQGPLERTVGDGILAVGSSAGQVYPFSAHGLKYAIRAGRFAGRVVAEGVREGDVSEEKLFDYESLWKNDFGKEIQTGGMLREALEISPDQKMDALIEVLNKGEELQKKFVKIFQGKDLENSLRDFFKEEECKRLFGKKRVDKILSLYS